MADVQFRVHYDFEVPARMLWDELVDWEAHAAWIPMTRMDVEPGDPTAVGAAFTAYTGLGPVALKDRMRVTSCDWDEVAGSGTCTVEKLGPVLLGEAGFTVASSSTGSTIDWFEDVQVKYLPRFLAPVAAKAAASGFKHGMKRLAKLLVERHAA